MLSVSHENLAILEYNPDCIPKFAESNKTGAQDTAQPRAGSTLRC